MPVMPAFCNSCGTVFGSGMVFENCRNVTLSGCQAGPCPNCGGTGHVPDGVFDFTENAIKVLAGTRRTIDELQRLAQILANAQKSNSTKEQVEQAIKDEVPELSSLISFLPKTRIELYAFITIILTAIGMLISTGIALQKNSPSEAEIQKMIDSTIEKSMSRSAVVDQPKRHIKNQPRKKNKTGRNALCPCGSGKKYKKCCLQFV